MACPKCGYKEWRLAKVVYQEGLSHVNTSTTGIGLSAGGGGLGLGVGGAKTSGIHQSALSGSASPPEDPNYYIAQISIFGFGILGFLYGWIIEDSVILGFLLLVLGGIGGLFFGLLVMLMNPNREYKRQMKLWEKTRMCTRCGCFY